MIDSRLKIDSYGNKYWFNSINQIHQENGPAVIYPTGDMHWYINDKCHRIDGPARVYSDGNKFWLLYDDIVRNFRYD